MRTGTTIALVIAAFATGALLTGAAASAAMGGWSVEQMWAACQSMMAGARPAGP